jgi:hypothetical protein
VHALLIRRAAYRILTKAQVAWQNMTWGGGSRIKTLFNLTEAAETAEEDPNARKYEKDKRFIYETGEHFSKKLLRSVADILLNS